MATTRAIYEGGVFRPVGPIELPDRSVIEFEPLPVAEGHEDAASTPSMKSCRIAIATGGTTWPNDTTSIRRDVHFLDTVGLIALQDQDEQWHYARERPKNHIFADADRRETMSRGHGLVAAA